MNSINSTESLTVEAAYQILADYLIGNAGDIYWDSLILESEVYDSMTTAVIYAVDHEKKKNLNITYRNGRNKATLFLRDNILETTGERFWNMTFSITKEGKMKINYGYEKPKNYEP